MVLAHPAGVVSLALLTLLEASVLGRPFFTFSCICVSAPFIAISEPVAEFHRLCLTADVAQDSNHSLGILESNSGILDSTGIAPIHLGSHTGMAPIHLDSHTGVAAILLNGHTAD